MYNYIKGLITEILSDRIIVENNGIGYEIILSDRDINKLYSKEEAKIFTYFHVREDVMQLYGFLSKEDKNIFLKLIDVSKIGTKTAIGILGKLDSDNLAIALENNDVDLIAKCPGIGKKTAQRLILELKGKLIISNDKETDNKFSNNNISDAFEALTGLGFDTKDIKKVFKNIDNIESLEVSDIVKEALKGINNA